MLQPNTGTFMQLNPEMHHFHATKLARHHESHKDHNAPCDVRGLLGCPQFSLSCCREALVSRTAVLLMVVEIPCVRALVEFPRKAFYRYGPNSAQKHMLFNNKR